MISKEKMKEQLCFEYLANYIYDLFDVFVPKTDLFIGLTTFFDTDLQSVVLISEYIPREQITAENVEQYIEDIQCNIILDCVLGFWNILGNSKKSHIRLHENRVVRVELEQTLRYCLENRK